MMIRSEEEEEEDITDYERNNYTITFDPVNCSHADYCSKCFAEIEILKEPQLFIFGKSRYDPEVIATNKKRAKKRKLQKLLRIAKINLQQIPLVISSSFNALVFPLTELRMYPSVYRMVAIIFHRLLQLLYP